MTKYLYNFIIELILFIAIGLWIIIGATIFIPFIWNLDGGEYFNIKEFIENFKDYKIK